MTKLFDVRRDQVSSSKSQMLDYTSGEHVVNLHALTKCEQKKAEKTLTFTQKIIIFSEFFYI